MLKSHAKVHVSATRGKLEMMGFVGRGMSAMVRHTKLLLSLVEDELDGELCSPCSCLRPRSRSPLLQWIQNTPRALKTLRCGLSRCVARSLWITTEACVGYGCATSKTLRPHLQRQWAGVLRDEEVAQVLKVCCEGVEQQQRQKPCTAHTTGLGGYRMSPAVQHIHHAMWMCR